MPEQNSLASYFAPQWWVRAFEGALPQRHLHIEPSKLTVETGVSPALTEIELGALLICIRAAQSQLLTGHKWLAFPPELLEKHYTRANATRSFLFFRFLLPLLHQGL